MVRTYLKGVSRICGGVIPMPDQSGFGDDMDIERPIVIAPSTLPYEMVNEIAGFLSRGDLGLNREVSRMYRAELPQQLAQLEQQYQQQLMMSPISRKTQTLRRTINKLRTRLGRPPLPPIQKMVVEQQQDAGIVAQPPMMLDFNNE